MSLGYYLGASPRRKMLDDILREYRSKFRDVVVDIGGRDRGMFQKPKQHVKQWIVMDIEAQHKPDIIGDVTNMRALFADSSIDVVLATELFEHVAQAEVGIQECYRILRPGGTFMASMPFLYHVHGDPFDYQRWTETQWQKALKQAGFTTVDITVMGRFFYVINYAYRTLNQAWWFPLRLVGYGLYPVFDVLQYLDEMSWVKTHPKLSQFHGGYFIVAVK
jgi:SAM-dependent methyltransferase